MEIIHSTTCREMFCTIMEQLKCKINHSDFFAEKLLNKIYVSVLRIKSNFKGKKTIRAYNKQCTKL